MRAMMISLAQSSSKFPSDQAEQGRQCQVYLLYNLCYNQNYCQRNMTRSHSVSCKFCSLESNSYSTLLICDQRSVCRGFQRKEGMDRQFLTKNAEMATLHAYLFVVVVRQGKQANFEFPCLAPFAGRGRKGNKPHCTPESSIAPA